MITSTSNARIKQLALWNQKAKERRKDGVFLAEGIKMFEELYRTGAYPGLGVVKKLSIMHHLQLMGEYLEENTI